MATLQSGRAKDLSAPLYNEYAVLRLEIRVSNPEMFEQTAPHCFHTRSEAHPASYLLVLGVVPGGKAAEY
jgi:hypothetical protein